MGLLKKGKKKPLRMAGGGAAATQMSTERPQQQEKHPPCVDHCPSGTDIRGWISTIAQREKLGLSEEEAYNKAWHMLVETNPFPAIMGRVCPHPCEDDCNRSAKDGAVSINAMERFIGDWGLEKKLPLPKLPNEDEKPESIGVIGAGPAGLSFAYQMARRGYPVTVYESLSQAGGMLYYGIPFYRLPEDVLQAEIQRILDVGVELKLNQTIGKDVTVEELRARHKNLFLGIGAHKGRFLGVSGEDGGGVFTGTDYLNRVNRGEKVELGDKVAVIGGGDTAIDAARAARRAGAEVTILYRRTLKEMPAIDSEVEDALKEDIKIDFLVAPVEVKRNGDKVTTVVVQKMELGEPDDSGRRRPVPIEGSEYEIPVDSIIAAISQDADWGPLGEVRPKGKWLEVDKTGKVEDGLWAGGDVLNLGIATTAVYHGRLSAETVHARLRGREPPKRPELLPIKPDRLQLDYYKPKTPVEFSHRPVAEWVSKPNEEINLGITAEQFLAEAERCFSCGLCFGCENCWMYCTPSAFAKEEKPALGNFYRLMMEKCDGCRKCADVCPCGFLDMV